ncbi:Phosphoglycerate mutase [Actinokineospora spheciospongiae]|uniref:Phosphoglycerate mutase n=1 Tax=Actinokineospora spheciospongiae TaxID=909613 RepID=W7JE26_9PSEU|nr:Phosphoglycerate mutase [Actinokineospora spheciospongiae]
MTVSTTEYRQSRFVPPPGATELLLVRHGESAPARPDRLFPLVDGQGDPELAPDGVVQARRVGARLAAAGVGAIYVTNLRRTAQTAAPLAEATGLAAVVERDLREVHLGEWEGGALRWKVAEGDPLVARMRAEQRWDVIPGAEGLDALRERIGAAVRRIHAAQPGRRVAVFTHGGVIAQVLAVATGAAPFAFLGADNGSLSHVVVDGDSWRVRRFNDTAHLAGDLSVAGEAQT